METLPGCQATISWCFHGLRNPTSQTSRNCYIVHPKQYSGSSIGIAKFTFCEVWNLYREVIPLTHSDIL